MRRNSMPKGKEKCSGLELINEMTTPKLLLILGVHKKQQNSIYLFYGAYKVPIMLFLLAILDSVLTALSCRWYSV